MFSEPVIVTDLTADYADDADRKKIICEIRVIRGQEKFAAARCRDQHALRAGVAFHALYPDLDVDLRRELELYRELAGDELLLAAGMPGARKDQSAWTLFSISSNELCNSRC